MSKKDDKVFERKEIRIKNLYDYEFRGAPFSEIIERVKKWAIENNIDDYTKVYFDQGYTMGYYNNPDLYTELSAVRLETDAEYDKRIAEWNKNRLRDLENAKKSKLQKEETDRKTFERLKKKYEGRV